MLEIVPCGCGIPAAAAQPNMAKVPSCWVIRQACWSAEYNWGGAFDTGLGVLRARAGLQVGKRQLVLEDSSDSDDDVPLAQRKLAAPVAKVPPPHARLHLTVGVPPAVCQPW